MLRLVLLLLLVPLFDVLLLVVLTGAIGWVAVVALVVLTALIGTLLVRAEGRHTLRKIQERLARGEVPTNELLDGALLLIAGVCLLTPGLVTDGIGFLLVLPFTRYPIRAALKRWVVTPYIDAKTGGFASGGVYVGGFPGDDGPGGPD
ncbi:MAG: FxsA family protein, partial [Salinirussus sp.]